ncbi:LOW QUALITY PROTEIN: unconventional myosin-VIIa [Synchiropus splendidus]|uniref:LOW QUALITY PROTEIN: unconventional myosin-VIIa n=1 Tax=Synchiropus splendidus TaxID=270530 RepID=UPI00237E2E93|nr:LOW QUALITY PROTEIN: unconventional myosin-VIIa [Synchiropus splendidus]
MHPTSVKGVDDMIRLGDLNEAGLLRNLLVRHKEGIIYTYTGSILVAVNPYQLLPIYTTEHVHKYTDRRLGELPPHVFALADSCFFNMRRNKKNQCCIISGESGAGKTESTKLMLQFLAAVSGQRSWIGQQILEANPILEAFGNAKTVRNDNSSRFGKYIDINFTQGGVIDGARIEQYLLEKSRVCRQAPEERNYHIFYYMLMGMPAEHKKILSLGNAAEYNYITMGNSVGCDGRDDVKEYANFRSALRILMFTENETWEIFKLLAAILHIGNIVFEGTIINNLEACDIRTTASFKMACQLLEVESEMLEKSLTEHYFSTSRESVTKRLTSAQAVDSRDAFVKAIYGRLFIWVVNKINAAVYKEPEEPSQDRQSIGLLDIFGFEDFTKNRWCTSLFDVCQRVTVFLRSFEQLCINFANEQLQQFFVKHVFKLEQEEYARENINWTQIDYKDNRDTLDVLANKRLNILALIDEESNFPKGTDATMIQKLNQNHGKGNIYIPPKNSYEIQFGINHFAGVVYYNSTGFLEKNRDALSSDLIQLVETSSNNLLKQVFHKEVASSSRANTNPKMIMTKNFSTVRQASDGKKPASTLSGQFRQSLDSLMKTLRACQPYFIRCIKPNDFKKPLLFDRDLCMRQLRYSGMMETIRIRKSGYPVRYTFDEFLERYRVLLKTYRCDPKTESAAKCCESICTFVLHGKGDWKTGKTKIFLKDSHDTLLELERMKELNQKALLIQKVLRGYAHRKRFLRKREAAVIIQKNWRGYKGKQQYRRMQLGFARLQAKIRSRQLQLHYMRQREAAILLQAHVRGYLARKRRRDMMTNKRVGIFHDVEDHDTLREVLSRRQERVSLSEHMDNPSQMVDSFFDFLPTIAAGQEGPPSVGSESVDTNRLFPVEIDIDDLPMEEGLPEEDYDDLDDYSFSKFAAVHFQSRATATHIRQQLHQPLLHHEDQEDVTASLTVWWVILRFMGDLPEPNKPTNNDPRLRGQMSSSVTSGGGPTLDRPLSVMEKLHIIVGYGIIRRDLRDEIYCQICKQLQENKNRNSYFRGWILLSLCLGIFPPSKDFMRYLQSFIRSAPGDYSAYCADRLRRTVTNGVRGEPPSWVELQAAKTKKPIVLTVTLMDGRSFNLSADSASTSRELCKALAKKAQLEDVFGFSLYVSLYDKVWVLGSSREHVLDAISQCEQEVKRKGGQEQHAPWQLLFRKEIFTPWHDCSEDGVSTDLIYRQIIKGLARGEFQTEKEDDLVQHAAKHLYVQHGSDSQPQNVKEVAHECIQPWLLEAKSESKWVKMISAAHAQGSYLTTRQSADSVKAEMVEYARKKWPMLFSRFFEVLKVSGPMVPKNKFIVAVNWTGITFLDEREKRLLELSFAEVTGVNSTRDLNGSGYIVSLLTLKGDFILSSTSGEDLAELVTMFLSGLTERSQYAVTLIEVPRRDDPTFLSFKKGELILIVDDNELSQKRGWLKGQSDSTGQKGAVSAEAILILPTLSRPSKEILKLINLSPNQRKNIVLANQRETGTMDRMAAATLREYSLEYFRQPTMDVNRQVMSRNAPPEKLWEMSREPIRLPLLKKLAGNSDLSQQACLAFIAILKYMGDYPTKQLQDPLELTDQIFGPATQNEALRDEIYCQIIKQMTSNTSKFSMEHGWQLLWLCCGLFPPSQPLLKHTQKFLETRRREALAANCLQRLKSSVRTEPRKLPPHQVEVEAIQQSSTKIFHKFFFPNNTDEVFEVSSNTRIKDLIQNISSKLKLSSADGFSLFVKVHDKLLSLSDTLYFFDGLRQITDWSSRSKRNQDGGQISTQYLVFFMRKLWYNVIPGRDPEADRIFHFPQELPKYLSGYHLTTKEDVVTLAALLLRVKVKNDKSQLVLIPKLLKELVPEDQLKAFSENEWKKSITVSFNKQGNMTAEGAKVAFLKAIFRWPTSGSAFFRVKQTSEPNFPDIVRIYINKNGMTVLHPKTKDVLVSYPFNHIANWSSGSTYFHMTLGSLVKGSKFLCETSQGYKMDDLLTSYVNMYRERKATQGHQNAFN